MKIKNDIKRRGRPAKSGRDTSQTKAELINSGVEHFTQFGFASSGLDQILKKSLYLKALSIITLLIKKSLA